MLSLLHLLEKIWCGTDGDLLILSPLCKATHIFLNLQVQIGSHQLDNMPPDMDAHCTFIFCTI